MENLLDLLIWMFVNWCWYMYLKADIKLPSIYSIETLAKPHMIHMYHLKSWYDSIWYNFACSHVSFKQNMYSVVSILRSPSLPKLNSYEGVTECFGRKWWVAFWGNDRENSISINGQSTFTFILLNFFRMFAIFVLWW